jgi:hypothetical protein
VLQKWILICVKLKFRQLSDLWWTKSENYHATFHLLGEVIKAPGPHEISPIDSCSFSLSYKEKKKEKKYEGCASSPSGDTTVLSRKELRKLATRDLFSWKITKPLPSWSCAHKRKERFKRRRIVTQPDQVQWSFWEIMK